MKLNRINMLLAASAVIMASLSPAAFAKYSNLFIFGDSLSDTGNLYLATNGNPPRPGPGTYDGGRYSDGPLWVEHLAQGLGLPATTAQSYILGGNNYAFAGAVTGVDQSPPGVLAQMAGIWNGVADANALYVVAAGGNDVRDARTLNEADRSAAVKAANTNLLYSLGYLAQRGVKNVLISNLPNVGDTPEASFLGLVAESSAASNQFNSYMPTLMGFGQSVGMNMTFFDMAGLMQNIITDGKTNNGAKYGITNVTAPCGDFYGSQGASCATSLFSDVLHPSAAVHQLIGQAALNAVAPVPEPETYALMGMGLLGLLAARRRKAQAVQA